MSDMTDRSAFPFAAVVGHDDVKLALLLCAVDARLGGVLLRGDKGTAKTTLARGLAALLPEAPFVELPLGASEDRVVGAVDVGAALEGSGWTLRPGLLAQADGGVLYVDEVNLLAGHLVDVLLDAAATGTGRVERDGLSHAYPARFVLAGSMNPEEGDLRPQLLDRFGLVADLDGHSDVGLRAEAVRRRLSFDADPEGFVASWAAATTALRADLARAWAAEAELPDEVVATVSTLCRSLGIGTLRADLTVCRAATALARLEGDRVVTVEHVGRVAPLALAHRRRRGPFDDGRVTPDEIAEALPSPAPSPGTSDGAPEDGAGPEGDGPEGNGPGAPEPEGRGGGGGGGGGAPAPGLPEPQVVEPALARASARELALPARPPRGRRRRQRRTWKCARPSRDCTTLGFASRTLHAGCVEAVPGFDRTGDGARLACNQALFLVLDARAVHAAPERAPRFFHEFTTATWKHPPRSSN
jgi:Mg-chelatase subunit ChlI